MFDDLPALAAPKPADLGDEFDQFLATNPAYIKDALAWWYERQRIYPWLSRMVMNYLSIPGVS